MEIPVIECLIRKIEIRRMKAGLFFPQAEFEQAAGHLLQGKSKNLPKLVRAFFLPLPERKSLRRPDAAMHNVQHC